MQSSTKPQTFRQPIRLNRLIRNGWASTANSILALVTESWPAKTIQDAVIPGVKMNLPLEYQWELFLRAVELHQTDAAYQSCLTLLAYMDPQDERYLLLQQTRPDLEELMALEAQQAQLRLIDEVVNQPPPGLLQKPNQDIN